MKKTGVILIALGILSILSCMACGRQASNDPIEEGTTANLDKKEGPVMLIDFCKKTVATVGGDGYTETVLYQNPDGSCEIHYYSKYEGDEEESHETYSVDQAVMKEAYDIIAQNDMENWNDTYDGPGLDGAEYILKFRTETGEYIRVNSDRMPDDGISIMYEVKLCMDHFVKEGDIIY